jgi:hypothetical protein
VSTVTVLSLLLAGTAPLAGCGEDEATRSIEIQQVPLPDGKIDLVLTVSEDLNTPETTDGAARVTVICRDSAGSAVVRSRRRWPFRKDGNPRLPHAHLLMAPDKVTSITKCAITGTSPKLEGRVGLGR